MKMKKSASVAMCAMVACNVPAPPAPTGGIILPEAQSGPAGPCGRGFVVLESQYQSTNVAVVDLSGAILSDSLVSSASGSLGLFVALSGDVVPMTAVASEIRLPLIDRAPDTAKIAWVDFATGEIVSALALNAGFPAYPQDYAPISQHKAYVSRFGHNRAPGQLPFDAGSDLLIVDPAESTVLGSVDLRTALGSDGNDNLPRPGRIVLRDARAFVLLAALPSQSFSATTSSRLAVVNSVTDVLEGALILEGLRNCTGLALSPNGDQIAAFCSALTDSKGTTDLAASGIALINVRGEPVLERILLSSVLGPRPVGFYGDYASDSVLLVTTFGAFDEKNEPRDKDTLLRIDLSTDTAEVLLESSEDPFTLGGVACDAGCGVCLIADAGRDGGVVHRYTVDELGSLTHVSAIKVETRIGLPPRIIGRF